MQNPAISRIVRINVVAAIIRKDGHILITQRPDHVHLSRLWEFPGGKVESGESLEAALEREIQEELGVKIRIHSEFLKVDHDYPSKLVRLHFFNCSIVEGDVQPLEVADLRWVKPEELCHFAFPPADAELIAKLCSEYSD
jgi:8-oxo-dGTP diphosphatase